MGYKIKLQENNTKVIDFETMEKLSNNDNLLDCCYKDINIIVLDKDDDTEIFKLTLILVQKDKIEASLTQYNKDDKPLIKSIKEAMKQLLISDQFERDINNYGITYDHRYVYSGILCIDYETPNNIKYDTIGMIIDSLDMIIYKAYNIHIRCLVIDLMLHTSLSEMIDTSMLIKYLMKKCAYTILDTHLVNDLLYQSIIRDYMENDYINI